MNLANKITLIRVFMVPFFVVAMLNDEIPHNKMVAGVVFIIAALSDLVDGKVARKYNMVTNFGKFMDPLADKLLVQAALICFTAKDLLPAWMVIIIMSREFIISGFRLVASDNGIVIAAGNLGKFKTVFQMVMSILLIFNFKNFLWNILEEIFIWGALILTVVSLVDYIYTNRKVLSENNV